MWNRNDKKFLIRPLDIFEQMSVKYRKPLKSFFMKILNGYQANIGTLNSEFWIGTL